MSKVKSEALSYLEKNKGDFFSGEKLAGELKVSRTAVNKAIKALIAEGYPITAVTNKGYCLAESDILSIEGIVNYLPDGLKGVKINFYKETDSTNNEAKKAIYTEEKPSVFVADEQTAGRGRLGRDFYSPGGQSVYLSLLVKPECVNGLKITAYAAVAVVDAIEELTSEKASIKWVNDVFIGDKKVAGILCEGVTALENNELEAAVIGVGMNCRVQCFPDELYDVAGNILENSKISRNELTAKVISNILYILDNVDDKQIMERYREKSMVLGKTVRYRLNGIWYEGSVINIDDNGALVVKKDNRTVTINSGEVTIRKI